MSLIGCSPSQPPPRMTSASCLGVSDVSPMLTLLLSPWMSTVNRFGSGATLRAVSWYGLDCPTCSDSPASVRLAHGSRCLRPSGRVTGVLLRLIRSSSAWCGWSARGALSGAGAAVSACDPV
jgi:hypothetical protein